jgi:hypothetical protein
LTEYDKLFNGTKTKAKVESFQQSTANEYNPTMYEALRDEKLSDTIEKDCADTWSDVKRKVIYK